MSSCFLVCTVRSVFDRLLATMEASVHGVCSSLSLREQRCLRLSRQKFVQMCSWVGLALLGITVWGNQRSYGCLALSIINATKSWKNRHLLSMEGIS